MNNQKTKTVIRHLFIEDTNTNPVELEVLLCRNRYAFYESEPLKDSKGIPFHTLEEIESYLEGK